MFTTLLVMRNVLLKCCTFVFCLRAILSIPKGWYPLYWNEKEMGEGKENAVDVNGIKCYVEEDDFGDTFHGTFFTSWDYEVLVWDEMMSFRSSRKAIEDTTEDLSSLTITRASAVKSVGSDEDSKFAQDLNESVDCCIDATALKEKIMETVFFMDAEQFCFVSKYWFNNWGQHTPATKKDTDGKRYNTPALLHKSLSGEVTFVMRDGKRKHARVSKESRRLGGEELVVKKTVSFHLDQKVPGDYRNRRWEARTELIPQSILKSRPDSGSESRADSSSERKWESPAESNWDTTSWLCTEPDSEPVWAEDSVSDLVTIPLSESDESGAQSRLNWEPEERLLQGRNFVGARKAKGKKRKIVKRFIRCVYKKALSCFRFVCTTQN